MGVNGEANLDYTDGRMFYAHPEQDFAVPDVAREGFEFDGWTLETDEKSLLTAQWQAEEEPIVFSGVSEKFPETPSQRLFRHFSVGKPRFSPAKPSVFLLELTKNPLELSSLPFSDTP